MRYDSYLTFNVFSCKSSQTGDSYWYASAPYSAKLRGRGDHGLLELAALIG